MRRTLVPLIGLGCLMALVLGCFWPVLFQGRQFAYRDAGHFYYPLYQRVQEVWRQGRLPLWDARENAGMPLLGNPTAAVLYPGKLIYAALPYPWAARIYVIAHSLLAAAGMYLLMRNWKTSRTGATIAGLSYSFGAPILFQYCNVIFLVGAAWTPFGLRAVDRWLRMSRRGAIAELALILAMELLGGDPQVAYVTGLCAGAYALGLTWAAWREKRKPYARFRFHPALILIGLFVWVALSLLAAWKFPPYRPKSTGPTPLPWTAWVPLAVLGCWSFAGVLILTLWRARKIGPILPAKLIGLTTAALLAGAIAAVQLLPVLEFTRRTSRAAEDGPHDIFPFSVEPFRVAEFAWPGFFGSNRDENRMWIALVPPRHSADIWVPSLYLGGLSLSLALGAFGFRGGPPYRAWLSGIAAVSLVAAMGEFASPVWVARGFPNIAKRIGPRDPIEAVSIRTDGYLRDGDGSVYGLMAYAVPGFGSFRYPSKLLTFTCLGLAGLAGLGWDRLTEGKSRRGVTVTLGLGLISLAALIVLQGKRQAFLDFLAARSHNHPSGSYGPLNPEGAFREARAALIHAMIVMGTGWALLRLAAGRRSSPRTAALALILVAGDLLIANSRWVVSLPQSLFETTPRLLALIDEAERNDPAPGPYRVHRMPYWDSFGFTLSGSPNRNREMFVWERDTLQPKYGLPLGVNYTLVEGTAELYDFMAFLAPFLGNHRDRNGPRDDRANPRLVYYPRRGFDLWNSRYFILPALNANDERRAISSFLLDTQVIAPTDAQKTRDWEKTEDWRLLKNKHAFPRAWIVHSAQVHGPLVPLRRTEERQRIMIDLLHQSDPFWTFAGRPVSDPRVMAWIELDTEGEIQLQHFLSHREPEPDESATVVSLEDERVEIEADLTSPGIVVLADVNYPGWELTIDGHPAPILKANVAMRGAAVPSGKHRLVYTYRPASLRIGALTTMVGLLCAASFAAWARFGPAPRP